jgi:TonB family protein
MRLASWALLGVSVALAAPAAATAEGPRDSEANAAFTVYPKESLARGEQGVVHYRVKLDRSGKPKVCEVTRSSGHERLDAATCNLLMDNARFTPNRDGRGRATRSTYDGKVHWRIG